MNGNDVMKLGYRPGKVVGLALKAAAEAHALGQADADIQKRLGDVLNAPGQFIEDAIFKPVAQHLMEEADAKTNGQGEVAYGLETVAPYKIWGKMYIEPSALAQMERAVRLPVSVRGALMPDAHMGYGLPIGGVLATHNAVIPYAVGVDIACRMRITIFDASPYVLEQKREKFRKALEANTIFGTGEAWDTPRDHAVLEDPAWRTHPLARQFKDVAWRQLGTSGSGNHFVEFGALEVKEGFPVKWPGQPERMVAPGKYLALLSHSGSRRFGFEMANHYTEVAMDRRKGTLPKDFLHLAWLDLTSSDGQEYWEAMTLAGKYASANHALIHEQLADALRFDVLGSIENHHNFAWKEIVDGQELIVHRKGATPAGEGVYGVIPGSMTAPGYIVRGLGNTDSISSASHGAGRKMSRHEALKRFDWDQVRKKLKAVGVEVISAGLDEVPGVYKDIKEVMAQQSDLVAPIAEFQPKLVKMDPGGKTANHFRED